MPEVNAKKNDLVLVMIRKRPKVARYVGTAPEGAQHIVNLETLLGSTLTDLRLVAKSEIYTLDRQPEAS